jgi:hypothetical protein
VHVAEKKGFSTCCLHAKDGTNIADARPEFRLFDLGAKNEIIVTAILQIGQRCAVTNSTFLSACQRKRCNAGCCDTAANLLALAIGSVVAGTTERSA